MRLYVLRHGETTSNASELIVGLSDVPLTEKGEQQARNAARCFINTSIPELIFSSPLIRAQKTAQIVNDELLKSGAISTPLKIITELRLIEQDYGKLEGQSRFLPEFAESKKQFADFTHVAESQLRLAARVYAFLDELKSGRLLETLGVTDNSVLLVTHGGICRIIHSYFHSMTIEEFAAWRAVNCEINEYEL